MYNRHKIFIRGVYMSWYDMVRRCYNKKCKSYGCYGGRGVTVCDEWVNSYEIFLEWSLNNGWEKGLNLDKDIKGDGLFYSPDTCCWVTNKVNATNTRACKKYLYKGEMMVLSEIADRTGVNYSTAYSRINTLNKSFEDSIKNITYNNQDKRKPIIQYRKDMVKIREYESVVQAAKEISGNENAIRMAAARTIKTSKGFIWRYK